MFEAACGRAERSILDEGGAAGAAAGGGYFGYLNR